MRPDLELETLGSEPSCVTLGVSLKLSELRDPGVYHED